MRDVAFSPDGSYFAIVTTGAYGAGTLCDATSRWESNATGTATSSRPGWTPPAATRSTAWPSPAPPSMSAVTSAGRTTPSPATGPAPARSNATGSSALDPDTGLALSWDPGRDRGVGVFVLYPTEQGLWLGSDTDRVAGRRTASWPCSRSPVAPSFRRTSRSGSPTTSTTCRSSPARHPTPRSSTGSTVAVPPCSRSTADPTGSATTLRAPSTATPATAPAGGPESLFPATFPPPRHRRSSSRSGGTTAAPPRWSGASRSPRDTPVEVRLYFANQYDGTANVGGRVFDVSVEGNKVLDNYDIVADTGGTQRAAR